MNKLVKMNYKRKDGRVWIKRQCVLGQSNLLYYLLIEKGKSRVELKENYHLKTKKVVGRYVLSCRRCELECEDMSSNDLLYTSYTLQCTVLQCTAVHCTVYNDVDNIIQLPHLPFLQCRLLIKIVNHGNVGKLPAKWNSQPYSGKQTGSTFCWSSTIFTCCQPLRSHYCENQHHNKRFFLVET